MGQQSACNAGDSGDAGSIPGLGRSPGEGKGYPLQYSGLDNSMDCIVHGVAKSRTQLSHFHFILIISVFSNVAAHSSTCHHQEAFSMIFVMIKADYLKSNQHIH